jgi:hypothetical protein
MPLFHTHFKKIFYQFSIYMPTCLFAYAWAVFLNFVYVYIITYKYYYNN